MTSTITEEEGNEDDYPSSAETFRVLFLGTGVSTAIPKLDHILFNTGCKICHDAASDPQSRNRRNNVSIAVLYKDRMEGKDRCILVDVGKTMRDSCLRLLPTQDVQQIDAIFLTHGHADAMLGLDDVRDLQRFTVVEVPDAEAGGQLIHGFQVAGGALPIYLTRDTMDVVSQSFGYLVNAPEYLDEAANVIRRRIACLDFNVISESTVMEVSGLPVRIFPVWHGGQYVSLGFCFGKEGEFVYISDVKVIPPETYGYLQGLPRIQTLVLDCLDRNGIWSHIGLEEALEVVGVLQPEHTYLVGMSCGLGKHSDIEAELSEKWPNVHLAYDGLLLSGFQQIGDATAICKSCR